MEILSVLLALYDGESTGQRWTPFTNTSDAELWSFLWAMPEQSIEQTIVAPVMWDVIALIMTLLWWKNHNHMYNTWEYNALDSVKNQADRWH